MMQGHNNGKIMQRLASLLFVRVGMLAVVALFFTIGYNVADIRPGRAGAIEDIQQGIDTLGSLGDGLGGFLDSDLGGALHFSVSDPSDVTVNETFCTPGTIYPTQYTFCDFIEQSSLVTDVIIYPSFISRLKKVVKAWEKYLYNSIDDVVYTGLLGVHTMELKMIEWWKTMWFYNMRPSMQSMTEQLGTAIAQQTSDLIQAQDAAQANETNADMQEVEVKDVKNTTPDEQGCVTATVSGGMGAASTIGGAMAEAVQNEAVAAGTNKKGTPAARGTAYYNRKRAETYESILCDPTANGGNANCASNVPSPNPLANSDTQITKFMLNRLTIPVDSTASLGSTTEGAANKAALTEGIENLIGSTIAEPIPPDVTKSSIGREMMMERRAFIARNAAARSVPNLILANRMPGKGSQMADFVKEIREKSGVPAGDLSNNPSYREMIHALTIDRFNSGDYAFSSITDQNKVEMEKLRLDTFYLMMLRDYYELLERTALTLAVQVSVMTDQIPSTNPYEAMPSRQ